MLALSTQLHNQTHLLIEFDVGQRVCALPSLRAGKTRSVKLSPILRCCRHPRGSSNWLIRVLINGEFSGIHLDPINHLILLTRLVFKCEATPNSFVFSVEGVREKRGVADYLRRLTVVGPIFGRNRSWRNRPVITIASSRWIKRPVMIRTAKEADSPPPINLREEVSEEMSSRKQGNGGKTATSESVINSTVDQRRIYRPPPALRREHNSTDHLLLLCAAFAIAALTHFIFK